MRLFMNMKLSSFGLEARKINDMVEIDEKNHEGRI